MRAATPLLASCLSIFAGSALAASADPGTLSEAVVTAAPYAVSLDSATTSIDVVTRADLDAGPAAGLGDVLSGLPGLRSSAFGPGASRPIIRGLSGPRVLVLQNGVGLVDASALSPDHAVASEPSEASRIEVLRGPSTLAYGGSAIGGVVNILDERIARARPEHGAQGRAAAAFGSVDDSYSTSLSLTAGRGPWVASADAAKRQSGDYRAPDERRVRNADVDLQALGAGLSYVGSDGYLGGSVKRTETRYGVPFAAIDAAGAPPEEGPVFIDLRQTRVDLRGETGLASGPFETARISAGYAEYQHAEIAVDSGEVGTRFLSRGGEGRLELVQRERDGRRGAVGVQGLTRRFRAIGDEAFVPPVDINEVGVFTLQRLDLGSWGVEGGLRLDRRGFKADLVGRPTSPAASGFGVVWDAASARRAFTNVSASGAVFARPAADLFLSLGLALNGRAPSEFELFADGPHAGTGAYELGDPTLGSERVASLEAVLRWTGDRLRLEVHAFAARYDGFIDEVPTGDRVDDDGAPDPAGELPVFRFVQTDARFRGGEAEGSYRVWRDGARSLSLEAAYDYVRARADAGRPARIPPYSLTGRLVWEGPRLEVRLEARHVGRQDRVADFETPTDGYTLVNARAVFRPSASRDLRLFLEGRNLTDREAREHASFLKAVAPLPGRNIRVGAAVSF